MAWIKYFSKQWTDDLEYKTMAFFRQSEGHTATILHSKTGQFKY